MRPTINRTQERHTTVLVFDTGMPTVYPVFDCPGQLIAEVNFSLTVLSVLERCPGIRTMNGSQIPFSWVEISHIETVKRANANTGMPEHEESDVPE